MMESFMCNWVTEEVSEFIDPKQYGSVKDSSTVHALVELIHLWQKALDNPGKVLRVLLLDYSRALDCVDHSPLLTKLANMGVHDCVVKWFTSFLCDRKQRTKIGDDISEWCTINAGAPQGTLFGPVGFIVHINDLRTRLPLYKYVDDSTAWEVCSPSAVDSQIQQAATEAVEWSDDNLMCVNCDKTKELLVFFGRTPPDIPSITIKGKAIESVTSTKLLGVIIRDDLAWGPHIAMIHGKASQRLYFLRLLKRAGVASIDIVRIYVSLVRSLLEYACQVWHTGLTVSDSDRLEGIQKRAMKIAFPELPYECALTRANINTLHSRREDLSRRF